MVVQALSQCSKQTAHKLQTESEGILYSRAEIKKKYFSSTIVENYKSVNVNAISSNSKKLLTIISEVLVPTKDTKEMHDYRFHKHYKALENRGVQKLIVPLQPARKMFSSTFHTKE
jgi:hypothetical protein